MDIMDIVTIMVKKFKRFKKEMEVEGKMIDIHSHILPKVDDGSKNMKMSVDMAKKYVQNGIKEVIATPHYIQDSYNKTKPTNKIAFEKLKNELEEKNIPLEIYLGNEIYISPKTLDDIEDGKVASLNGTRYVLLELPMYDIPIYFEDVIYGLLLKGYIPIIAHPERNKKIIEDPNLLYGYIQMGALAQLNLPSLEGRYGKIVEECATTLLKHNMIHFVGLDAHDMTRRPPKVGKTLERLKGILNKTQYEKIISINAGQLIKNETITIEQALKVETRKWYHFFRK